MTASRIEDMTKTSVEHMLGTTFGPLVILRVQSENTVVLGHLQPEAAREIAAHLFEAAARAEYEADFWHGLKARTFTDEMAGELLHIVRNGEARRHES